MLMIKKKYEFYINEVVFIIEFETIDIYFDYTPSFDIEFYIKHHNFSHLTEMIIKRFSDIRNMNYKYFKNNPMNMVEKRLNMIIVRNPDLITPLNRRVSYPLIRKYSHIPFNN